MATATSVNKKTSDSSNYHTVVICEDLPKVRKYYKEEEPKQKPPHSYWIKSLDDESDENRYKVQCMMKNGPYTSSTENHALFSAFLFAYNSHEDIVLSPDDIWFTICVYFSQHVNENAEQLRTLFVEEGGRKKLTVVQIGLLEPDWDDFLTRIQVQIGENVKNNTTTMLTPSFSTTTKVEQFLSYATIMDTFQKYFEYECYITRCGIRRVHFMGTEQDWKELYHKTENLKVFTRPNGDKFASYIDGILPILKQFINTYKKKVDNEFWNKVMDIEHVGNGMSGRMPGDYVSGWFLKLCYGLHTERSCEIKQIKLPSVVVPVEVKNEMTNQSKTCYITGGFHGVNSHNECHKPVMSLAIIEDKNTIKPFKA